MSDDTALDRDELIEALKVGGVHEYHLEQVHPRQLREYLDGSDDWLKPGEQPDSYVVRYELDDLLDLYVAVPGDGGGITIARPTPQEVATMERAFQTIAEGEGRGELAVWCDVVGAEVQ